jgi:homoserine kinase
LQRFHPIVVMKRIRVFVPGSIGNVGPGLDVLGLAVRGRGDTLLAERTAGRDVIVRDAGHPDISSDPTRHASAIAASAAMALAGRRRRVGLALSLTKGLPLSGGQGGSAASAVAGAFAANLLMGNPLSTTEVLSAALAAETELAGRHLDNIAPALLGGLVLIRSLDPIDVVRIRMPPRLRIVLAKPDYQLETKRGRAVLPRRLDREVALYQAAQIAAIAVGAALRDLGLIGRAIDDRIAEPVRAPLLPGFAEAKRAALAAGALGCSISGSGPTAFALADGPGAARAIGRAMARAYRAAGFAADVRLTATDDRGARIVR